MRYATRRIVKTEMDAMKDQTTQKPEYWEFINTKSTTKGNREKYPGGDETCIGNQWCHPRFVVYSFGEHA
jgi:hypothetical protein